MQQVALTILFCCTTLNGTLWSQNGPANNQAEYEKLYQERITKDCLYGVYIPKNLDDVMLELDKMINLESQSKIKGIPTDSVCTFLHKRLGQWMITNWGFYEGSRLSHYLRSAGITYPDDMADFLLLAYHKHLNGQPIPIKDLSVAFREKRRKEREEELKNGEVIHEETRKKN